jgi:APA family basic amino acid/polyamine antiporter
MGLGAILGTGIFVSVGIAAGVAGPAVLAAVALAAIVASFNGLSSAQLAASHPVSGGTYEYGYRYLNPVLGFTAGWMFLCAKSASAATAALGFAGYLLSASGLGDEAMRVWLALAVVVVLTLVVASGMKRSNLANSVIVATTLLALGAFVLVGAPAALDGAAAIGRGLIGRGQAAAPLLEATALMFVAYTGYGRIATLGEEIRDPERNIPRAIVLTLLASMLLYLAVVAVAIGAVGAEPLAIATGGTAAPLAVVAERFPLPEVSYLVAIGAVTAMAGVLLNLLLGLSRVLLAMARRGDMPAGLAQVDPASGSPRRAVLVTGAIISGLVLIGDIKTTWSFSAFTVLVYYALTNLAALRLPAEARRYPRWVAALGLVSCLGLSVWIDPNVLLAGGCLLVLGLLWHIAAGRLGARSA